MWVSMLLSLIFVPFVHAEFRLGSLAGGDLWAVQGKTESGGETSGSFSVVWQKGKQKKIVVLGNYSMPTVGADSYQMESAKLNGNEISVVVRRIGAYGYRGNDRTTYRVTFFPKSLAFSKVRREGKSEENEAEERIRAFFRKSCDPIPEPSDEFISDNVAITMNDTNSVMKEDIYGLLFEEMHSCALKEFRKGNKARAREIMSRTLGPLDSKKDWICHANETEEQPTTCKTRKSIFLDQFVFRSAGMANDMGFFLTGDASTNLLAKDVLTAVTAAAPNRASARLNYADVLWELGERAAAKEQYRAYLEISLGKNKATLKEREKAKERVGK